MNTPSTKREASKKNCPKNHSSNPTNTNQVTVTPNNIENTLHLSIKNQVPKENPTISQPSSSKINTTNKKASPDPKINPNQGPNRDNAKRNIAINKTTHLY